MPKKPILRVRFDRRLCRAVAREFIVLDTRGVVLVVLLVVLLVVVVLMLRTFWMPDGRNAEQGWVTMRLASIDERKTSAIGIVPVAVRLSCER